MLISNHWKVLYLPFNVTKIGITENETLHEQYPRIAGFLYAE